MLLSLDIGNSALKAAVFRGATLVQSARFPYAEAAPEALGMAIRERLDASAVTRIAISSVVPAREAFLREAFPDLPVFRVSHKANLPLRLLYDAPARLGTDRIALAAAALEHVRSNTARRSDWVVAVDAGTAVTFNVVNAAGTFHGGLIWAGPDLVRRALHEGTAQLPESMDHGSIQVVAQNPEQAIQSAAMLGFIEGTRGILGRIEEELGETVEILVTGGRGSILNEELAEVQQYDPHLVLHGIRIIADLNPDF